MQQILSEQQSVLERAQRAELMIEQLMKELQESKRMQEEIQSALEEQKATVAQQKILMDNEKIWQGSKIVSFKQALEGVRRDRDSM